MESCFTFSMLLFVETKIGLLNVIPQIPPVRTSIYFYFAAALCESALYNLKALSY